jgi:hypothetical protein
MASHHSSRSSTSRHGFGRHFSFFGLLVLSLLTVIWLHQDELMILVSSREAPAPTVVVQQQQRNDLQQVTSSSHYHEPRPPVDLTFTLSEHDADTSLQTTKQPPPPPMPFCSREEIIQGKWVPVWLPKAPYITPVTHLRCHPKEYYQQSPFPSYEWVVANSITEKKNDYDDDSSASHPCLFSSFSPISFCQMTQHAHILIAGDSLSWEHYSSLVQLLGVQTHQGFQHQSKAFSQPIGHAVCDGNTKVWYYRDDKLQKLHEMLVPTTATTNNNSQLLPNALNNEFTSGLVPNILVLNRGAHYTNDTALVDDLRTKTFPAVQRWLQRCREIYGEQHCHFLWRTSVPGHAKCDSNQTMFEKPLNRLSTVEAHIQRLSNYNERSINYHWQDYQHQNKLVINLLQEFFPESKDSKNMMILDGYYLNVLRPDEHRAHQGDCLHNCYPGKMDVYSRWLLHAIQYNLQKYRQQHYQGQASKENTTSTTILDFQDDTFTNVIQLDRVQTFQNSKQWLPTDTSTVYDKEAWMAKVYSNKHKSHHK